LAKETIDLVPPAEGERIGEHAACRRELVAGLGGTRPLQEEPCELEPRHRRLEVELRRRDALDRLPESRLRTDRVATLRGDHARDRSDDDKGLGIPGEGDRLGLLCARPRVGDVTEAKARSSQVREQLGPLITVVWAI
jgi:hypothetical protein